MKKETAILYECEKCGYVSPKTFLFEDFEHKERKYCYKCLGKFWEDNLPKAHLIPTSKIKKGKQK